MDTLSRGTEWRVWDLHVHTPASVVQHYGPNDEDTWDRFISELEALPPHLKVVGINDYWFLDGYRKVLAARDAGRLQNLDEILPIVELRLDMFSGAGGPWKRVNLHVIFDPDIGVDAIEQQFINALSNEFDLAPGQNGSKWNGAVTRESLADLGAAIKANVPAEELKHYGSDLQEGFNNLVVPLDSVRKLLDKSYLKGRTLVGVGRAEWAAIKWSDGSIAAKKNVINFADLVFTASQDISTWPNLVNDLRQSNVTHKLLDCSDAHHWSDSDQFERLGRCNTWINAAPSFAGLSHALEEFDDRVYVGLEPPVLARIRRHPHHFIDGVKISSSDPVKHQHFDYQVPLNSGFIAIIGNKGQGKSALLDSIALAGNSTRTNEFAFLNPKRFLSSSNRSAKDYYAEVSWADGSSRRRSFSEGHDSAAPVQVEYLPQAFVERLCTSDPRSVDDDEFEAELRAILFTHIPDDERAGEVTFDDLLARRTRSVEDRLVAYRRDLNRLVENYLVSCRFRAENSLADVEAKSGKKKIEVSKANLDLEAAKENLARLESEGEDDPELTTLRNQVDTLTGERELQETLLEQLLSDAGGTEQRLLRLNSLEQRIEAVATDASVLNAEAQELLGPLRPNSEPLGRLVELVVNRDALTEWRAQTVAAQARNGFESKAIQEKIADLDRTLSETTTRLASKDSVRELARQQVDQLADRVKSLTGDAKVADSLRGLEDLRDRVAAVPATMKEQVDLILAKAGEIHDAVVDQLDAVASLYEPAADFIRGSKAIEQAELEFKADLRVVPSLRTLGAQLDARRSPELTQSVSDLPSRIHARDWPEIEAELRRLVEALSADRGQTGGEFRNPELAMRNGFEPAGFFNELFGMAWIEVRFGLTGGGYPLSQLSPGQRGLILALFYLVVDRRETPLLLDQPEENLDNEAISDLLVPALKEAAGRRQTLVVTHNANLAVVGDADQIIHCRVESGVFRVDSGSIADLATAQYAVNVLEGRMPSFSKRRFKWEVFPQLHP